MIGRRSAVGASDPVPLIAILDQHATYEARLDAALAHVAHATELPDAYLYVAHEGGRHLHLERSRATAAAAPVAAGPAEMASTQEGGTEWSVATPPFELGLREGEDRLRAVDSPVGRLLSLPLHTPTGVFVGVVQVGPLPGDDPPKGAVARHAAMEPILATVIASTVREEAIRRRAALAEAQLESNRRLAASALDVEQLVGLLLDLALSSTQSEAGFVAIADPEGELRITEHCGLDATVLEGLDLDPETGLFDWSLGQLTGSLILGDPERAQDLGIRSLLAVPLIEDGQRLGIFALLTLQDAEPIGERGLELLSAFADQIRLMLHNARTFGDFSTRYLETLTGLASSLDAARPEYADHHERVSRVGRALAAGVGLAPDEVEAIASAGRIHDVGMVAIAGVEGAFAADIQHPAVGASLVEHLPLHRAVANAVACHHEWFDGWGFPNGLEGRAIPRAGRVLALAEFLVEMSTPDAARPAWTGERLVEELRQRRGSQFDPEITDVAVQLIATHAPLLVAARVAAEPSLKET